MDYQNENTTYLGIDVSKDTLDLFYNRTQKHWQVNNNQKGHDTLIAFLKKATDPISIMEASGGYEKALLMRLLEAGFKVARVDAYRVRCFAKAIGQIAKTDTLDARVLAQYGEKTEIRLLELAALDRIHLGEFLFRREQLINMRTAESNRLKQASTDKIQQSIQSMISYIDSEINKIDKDVDGLVATSKEMQETEKQLTSVVGIGKTTSRILMANLTELGICDRKEIAMLVGIAPVNRDSGTMRGKRAIYGGRKRVRKALYNPTMVAMQHNPAIRDFANELRSRGKAWKVIVIACMRKLLTILNAMMKNGTYWNQHQPFVTPI